MSSNRFKTLVIGAQNIDIYSHPHKEYVLHDSNPSQIHIALGGVGGNIATNIRHLGCKISFLTVFGNDHFGELAINEYKKLKIDISESIVSKKHSNSIYMGIMDHNNDLYLGLNDMSIIEELNTELFQKKHEYINSFEVLIIDNNLNIAAINYLLETYKDKIIAMDGVSAAKISKIEDHLKYINILKVNVLELSTLSKKTTKDAQIQDCLAQGLKEIIVTDSANEIVYQTKQKKVITHPIKIDEIVNTSGAGDAFFSGFMHGVIHHEDINVKLNYARNLAYLTLKSPNSTTTEVLDNE